MQSRRCFLSLMVILAASVASRGQEPSPEALRKENELLRMERDALLREKKEARTEIEQARIEIEALKAKLDRLTQGQKAQKTPPSAPAITTEASGMVGGTTITNLPERGSRKSGTSVKGKITEIGEMSALVALSIGSDDGLAIGQELECYRLGSSDLKEKDPPLYIGKVRILRVTPKQSVGQFVPLQGLDRRPKVGDEVANELLPK